MGFASRMIASALLCATATGAMAEDLTLDAFDKIDGWQQAKTGKFSLSKDGDNSVLKIEAPITVTKPYKFTMEERLSFDRFKGISFRVKGEAANAYAWGAIRLSGIGAGNWVYTRHFPITGDWQTVTIAWDDFIPGEACQKRIGETGALTPIGIDAITFGDYWTIWHRNQKIPAYTYYIDDLKFVESATPERLETFPLRKLSDAVAKMKSGAPVTVLCCGDSITAGTSVKEPDLNRYAAKLQENLRKRFGNDKIDVTSIGVGGAHSGDLLCWAERDFKGKSPDLVTVMIGYNDKSAAVHADAYKATISKFIDRVNSLTSGSPAFLLLATIPGQAARFTMMDDYADSVRALAAERDIAIYDLAADFKTLGAKGVMPYFADMAHPNNEGHAMIADKIAEFLAKDRK